MKWMYDNTGKRRRVSYSEWLKKATPQEILDDPGPFPTHDLDWLFRKKDPVKRAAAAKGAMTRARKIYANGPPPPSHKNTEVVEFRRIPEGRPRVVMHVLQDGEARAYQFWHVEHPEWDWFTLGEQCTVDGQHRIKVHCIRENRDFGQMLDADDSAWLAAEFKRFDDARKAEDDAHRAEFYRHYKPGAIAYYFEPVTRAE